MGITGNITHYYSRVWQLGGYRNVIYTQIAKRLF